MRKQRLSESENRSEAKILFCCLLKASAVLFQGECETANIGVRMKLIFLRCKRKSNERSVHRVTVNEQHLLSSFEAGFHFRLCSSANEVRNISLATFDVVRGGLVGWFYGSRLANTKYTIVKYLGLKSF